MILEGMGMETVDILTSILLTDNTPEMNCFHRAVGKTGRVRPQSRVQAEQKAAREQCNCSNRHRSVQFA